MKLSIVIPVMGQEQYTKNILEQLSNQTVPPDEVILINNGDMETLEDTISGIPYNFDLNVIHEHENIGVNPAWNKGIELAEGEYVGIWNNDLNIPDTICENIIQTFDRDASAGIVLPKTVTNSEDFEGASATFKELNTVTFRGREGWCFTIRKTLADTIGPIPPMFKMWFGDDYLFMWTVLKGKTVKMMTGCQISHFGSKTTIAEFGSANEQQIPWGKQERKVWNTYLHLLRKKKIIQ